MLITSHAYERFVRLLIIPKESEEMLCELFLLNMFTMEVKVQNPDTKEIAITFKIGVLSK